ncbi:MAG: exosortase [Planctomycetia bacterium]|nr:exosortase [Planctomycetia bacterium]
MPNESFLSQFEVPQAQRRPVAMLLGLAALLILFYWNTLREVSVSWNNPEYSHGWLVPLFAAVLLWLRREPISEPPAVERWYGVGLLSLGLVIRMAGTYIGYPYIDGISFLPALFGVFLVVGGASLLRWAGPALGFLVFMYPLPGILSRALLNPLQRVATVCSTFALQTLGVASYRSGNIIRLGEIHNLNVVDACSGLRMSTIFLALAVAITLITTRPWWERVIIILSAIPIALLVNIIRITVTGVLYLTTTNEIAEVVFHDLAGWIMMPLAMGFLLLELHLLSLLFLEDEEEAPMPIGMVPAAAGPRLPGQR